jgi:Acetyltransferase (GNAT) domain
MPFTSPSSFPPTREQLVSALETSMFVLPEVQGETKSLSMAGLRGRVSTVSSPLSNLVGLSTLTPQDADATIQRVIATFASERKAFGWMLGPSSTPADLGQRLSAAGLFKLAEMAGMAMTDIQVPAVTAPDVRIRLATGEDLELASQVLARAYPAPEDACRQLNRLMLRHMHPLRARVYLAYVGTKAEPVAYASLYHLPDQPIACFFSSATLPEYRHQRIYASLLARRLADARADGARAAILQAVRDTSAPICRKLGFTELCALELYAWMPED